MPDVSIQSALGVLLNYNGLTNRFIEGSPTYITEGISDSSITSNGTIFSGTNGYLVKTFGNTTLNKYYPEFKITCSGYLRDLRDITKDILYPVYSGNIKYSLSDVQIRLLIKLVQAPNTLGIYGDIVNSTGSSIETFKLFNLSVYNQRFISIIKIKECIIEDYKVKEAEFQYDEAKQVAKKFGVEFEDFNEYDWHYALNICYHLFKDICKDDIQMCAKLTYLWLCDKAIPEGKAFYHYMKHLKHKHKEDRD